MQENKKVIAAIASAVGLYLEAERLAAAPLMGPGREPVIAGPPYSPWALSGRQAMMDMRRMLQMRLAH